MSSTKKDPKITRRSTKTPKKVVTPKQKTGFDTLPAEDMRRLLGCGG